MILNTRKLLLITLVCCIGFFLSACTSTGVNIKTEMVKYGKLEYYRVEKGSPRVIFINGGGPSSYKVWRNVYAEIQKKHSVFAYNRFGSGKSSKTKIPQSAAEVVDNLHRLLKQASYKPKYILVGHSLGGLYANLYARRYPQEIAGVVLVDAVHPAFNKRLKQANIKQGKLGKTLLNIYRKTNPTKYSEVESMGISRVQLQQAAAFPAVPLTVVSAGKVRGSKKRVQVIRKLQLELVALSPHARHVIAKKSGHMIQRNEPELIINLVKEMIDKVSKH